MKCEARNYADGDTRCQRCGFMWETSDPEPPACLTSKEIGNRAIEQLKKDTNSQPQ